MGDSEVLTNLRLLETELQGAGVSRAPTRADGVTDVLVAAPNSVWVDDGSGLARSAVTFADESSVRRLAQRFALAAGRRLDEAQPWVDGRYRASVGDGLTVRLHAVLPPVASAGTCLSLRVLRPATQDLASLERGGHDRPGCAAVDRRYRRGASGVRRLGRHRCGQDHPPRRHSRRGRRERADRLHRGCTGTGSRAPAFRSTRGARGERGGCR